jgi:hypothetical protein
VKEQAFNRYIEDLQKRVNEEQKWIKLEKEEPPMEEERKEKELQIQ